MSRSEASSDLRLNRTAWPRAKRAARNCASGGGVGAEIGPGRGTVERMHASRRAWERVHSKASITAVIVCLPPAARIFSRNRTARALSRGRPPPIVAILLRAHTNLSRLGRSERIRILLHGCHCNDRHSGRATRPLNARSLLPLDSPTASEQDNHLHSNQVPRAGARSAVPGRRAPPSSQWAPASKARPATLRRSAHVRVSSLACPLLLSSRVPSRCDRPRRASGPTSSTSDAKSRGSAAAGDASPRGNAQAVLHTAADAGPSLC